MFLHLHVHTVTVNTFPFTPSVIPKITDPPVTKKGAPPESDDLEDTDDGLPDTFSGEELIDKRYTGGAIPSRSFRMLQMSVGNGDTSETGITLHTESSKTSMSTTSLFCLSLTIDIYTIDISIDQLFCIKQESRFLLAHLS